MFSKDFQLIFWSVINISQIANSDSESTIHSLRCRVSVKSGQIYKKNTQTRKTS